MAFEVTALSKIHHDFSCVTSGTAWLESFMRRHPPLTYQTPEPTAVASNQMERFYNNLGDLQVIVLDSSRALEKVWLQKLHL